MILSFGILIGADIQYALINCTVVDDQKTALVSLESLYQNHSNRVYRAIHWNAGSNDRYLEEHRSEAFE